MMPYVSAIVAIIRKHLYKNVQRKATNVYIPLYIFVEIFPGDGRNLWNM
jgi:hypothetical protein